MKKLRKYMLFTFATTTEALSMENMCAAEKLPGRLIPVPPSVAAGCGLAWRVEEENFEVVQRAALRKKMQWDKITSVEM